MKLVYRLSDWIFKIEKVIAMILCLLILIALTAGVLYRYVFSSPLTWSDETAIFSLVWLTFIGGSMSIKAKSAPTITILTDLLKGNARKIVVIIGYLSMVVFVGYVLYLAMVWITLPNISIQRSSSMQLPMIYGYLCIPVSFAFMLIHSLELLLKSLLNKDAEVV